MNRHTLFSFLLLLALTSTDRLASQTPVKQDLMEYFKKLNPPPASAADAYAKADCGTVDDPKDCTLDGLFQPLEAELLALSTRINSPETAAAMAGGGDLAKAAQDPAFAEKIKNMSDADKMKLAMAYTADIMKSSKPSSSYEKPAVVAVIKEIGEISDVESKESMNALNEMNADNQELIAFEAKEDSVDNGEDEAVDRLPKTFRAPSDGGGTVLVADPAAERTVRMNHWETHMTLAHERIARLGKRWMERRSAAETRYKKFCADLAAIHYGDDARGDGTRKMLASGQTKVIIALQNLDASSRQLWELGAKWQQRKLRKKKEVDDRLKYGN